MNLGQVFVQLRASEPHKSCITAIQSLPLLAGAYADFPPDMDRRLEAALLQRGIAQLYTHQRSAFDLVQQGKHVAVVAPTASGKSLCYHLPVIDRILKEPTARALYLYPTKALAQDQLADLQTLTAGLDQEVKVYTYDGDTPPAARHAIRRAGQIVITNPDMLHTAILPHHTKWLQLFENLRYVVIDELHTYRGVFGSHTANVFRRLKRICRHYGSSPQFICTSATIANPAELASRLTEEEFALVAESGAPSGEKHVIFYNPPVVNRSLGLRRSALMTAKGLGEELLANDVQTILFARSRLAVEVLLTHMKEAARAHHRPEESVRGYRGGYLPLERRAIERGLRDGQVRAVVSTNALELGIDIGSLDASILVGYPGSIASAWQQMGRAGRRADVAVAIYVATSSPLDQYLVTHPDYFFEQSPEHALINPDNLLILMSHLKCAAFELPFTDAERFGVATTQEMLRYLEEEGVLHHTGGRWHWMNEGFPAEAVSLRSASQENFVIVDVDGPTVIGSLDRYAAPMLLHEEAIYLHEGRQYQVERLDYGEKKAYVRKVDVDYYTDAQIAVDVSVIDVAEEERTASATHAHGDVNVRYTPTKFKKIKFETRENIGFGPIHLPEESMHTAAYWVGLLPEATEGLAPQQLAGALLGLGNLLASVAPLYVMCDPRDLQMLCQVRSEHTGLPTVYIYESYPGGVGFSAKLYDLHRQLLERCSEIVAACPCDEGCPSCVGAPLELGQDGKRFTIELVGRLLQ